MGAAGGILGGTGTGNVPGETGPGGIAGLISFGAGDIGGGRTGPDQRFA